jgi:4-coumarate--CoA ligase
LAQVKYFRLKIELWSNIKNPWHASSLVAAGLRCTLANSAYNARELAFQYTDSGARLIFTSENGYPTVQETLKSLGLSQQEADQRVVVMTDGLEWAGGPAAASIKPDLAHLIKPIDLLKLGTLKGEERFDGEQSVETVYLCYSSGRLPKSRLTPDVDLSFRYNWTAQGS